VQHPLDQTLSSEGLRNRRRPIGARGKSCDHELSSLFLLLPAPAAERCAIAYVGAAYLWIVFPASSRNRFSQMPGRAPQTKRVIDRRARPIFGRGNVLAASAFQYMHEAVNHIALVHTFDASYILGNQVQSAFFVAHRSSQKGPCTYPDPKTNQFACFGLSTRPCRFRRSSVVCTASTWRGSTSAPGSGSSMKLNDARE
jgi:hypothetical protein